MSFTVMGIGAEVSTVLGFSLNIIKGLTKFTDWPWYKRHNCLVGAMMQMPPLGKCLWKKMTPLSVPPCAPRYLLSSLLCPACVWLLGWPRFKVFLGTEVIQCLSSRLPCTVSRVGVLCLHRWEWTPVPPTQRRAYRFQPHPTLGTPHLSAQHHSLATQ